MAKIQEVTTEVSVNMRTDILTTINTHNGVKGVELVLNVMGMRGIATFNDDEYMRELLQLVSDGEIIELEYSFAGKNKSIYFPKGTHFHVPKEKVSNDDGSIEAFSRV